MQSEQETPVGGPSPDAGMPSRSPGDLEAPRTPVSYDPREHSRHQRDVERLLLDLEARYKDSLHKRDHQVAAWMVGCILASVLSQTPIAQWLYTRVTTPLFSAAWQGTKGAGGLLLLPFRFLVCKPRQLILEAHWRRQARQIAKQYRQQSLLRRQEIHVAAHALPAAGLDPALMAAATAVALAAAGNNSSVAAGPSSAGPAAPSSSGGASRGVVVISRPTPPRVHSEIQPASPGSNNLQELRNSTGSLSMRLAQLAHPTEPCSTAPAPAADAPGTSAGAGEAGPAPCQSGSSSTEQRPRFDLFSLFDGQAGSSSSRDTSGFARPPAVAHRGERPVTSPPPPAAPNAVAGAQEQLGFAPRGRRGVGRAEALTAAAAAAGGDGDGGAAKDERSPGGTPLPLTRTQGSRTPTTHRGSRHPLPDAPPHSCATYNPYGPPGDAGLYRSVGDADMGPDMCVSEVMSVASVGSEGAAGLGTGELEGCDSGCVASPVCELEEEEEVQDPEAPRFLGLPACVGSLVMSFLDTEGIRVLRAVCRSLYFEASRYIKCMVVTPSNLETLVAMPLHTVMPNLHTIIFRAAPPTGALPLPSAYAGPHAPLAYGAQLGAPLVGLQGGGATHAEGSGPAEAELLGSFNASAGDTALLMRFIHEVVPHLKHLSHVDVSESPLHGLPPLWAALLEALPGPHTRLIMREHSAWARGAMGLLGTPASLRDASDHYPDLFDALRKANRHMLAASVAAQPQGEQEVAPPASDMPLCVDLLGITVRRNTAARLPQLCALQCLTSLTLFGKSAAAATHGHRLAGHLSSIACLKHLHRLELLSYEDVSDTELAPLTACTRLRHLYLDSLFIKQASGPVFPSLVSLTAARIKFILRPLTTIFPNLAYLRLGVLHSELNKKISSASLSCLAGCSKQLTHLCVCPVLWKGQWQVLPTLPGLTHLQLVHCRDPIHLREVLRVVGRAPHLQHLELHAVTAVVPPWPGAASESDNAAGPGVGGAGAAAEIAAAVAAAAAAAEAAGGDEDAIAAAVATAAALAEDAAEGPGSVVDTNIYTGLAECKTLRSLVIGESGGRLVRHLVASELPGLKELVLRRMGSALKLSDLQAAVLALPGLQSLVVEASGDFSVAALMALPTVLARPSLRITWHATAREPSLLFARDCCQPLPE